MHTQVPMPLFGTGHIFSKGDFTAWVAVAMTWLFCGTIGVVLYPLFESRVAIATIASNVVKDAFGIRPSRAR